MLVVDFALLLRTSMTTVFFFLFVARLRFFFFFVCWFISVNEPGLKLRQDLLEAEIISFSLGIMDAIS